MRPERGFAVDGIGSPGTVRRFAGNGFGRIDEQQPLVVLVFERGAEPDGPFGKGMLCKEAP